MPDGVKRVELAAPDGSTSSVDVSRNAWTLEIGRNPRDARPSSISWTSEAGASHQQAVPYSPDVDKPCN